MTDSPPPYPGIQPYESPHHGAGAAMGQQGIPAWANQNYNGQPMSQAGAYPGYGQPSYNSYPQNPPSYSPYPQGGTFAQTGAYQQPGSYNPYTPQY